MNDIKVLNGSLNGVVSAPPSKSVAHRALICAALSGNGVVRNIGDSKDIEATLSALKSMGFEYTADSDTIIFTGHKNIVGKIVIDCNESGSTLRFLVPVAAALGLEAEFIGKGRLPSRPIAEYKEVLSGHAVELSLDNNHLPLNISGELTSGVYKMPGNISSQYISGMLMALPLTGGGEIELTTELESAPYVDITLDVMRRFGVECIHIDNKFIIKSKGYTPCTVDVEGDYSQAAFWLVAGAISGDITVKNLYYNSSQGDKEIINILKRFGADIETIGNNVVTRKSNLKGIEIDARDTPDLVPILTVAGAYASGRTRIYNAIRLKLKESDRLKAVADLIRSIGGNITETDDGLIIEGSNLTGGQIESYNDHRIAMSAAVAALGCRNGVSINDYKCVDKSYPMFYKDFINLGGAIDGIDLGK